MQSINLQKIMLLLTEIETMLVNALRTGDISFFNSTIENSILIPDKFIDQRSLMIGMQMCCILLCCTDIY